MKCKCHAPNHADERLWTINLNVNFSMNASKILCKLRFFIFDANAFYKDANAKCPYDANVPCRGVNLFMMMPMHAFKPWCKCLLTEMEMQMSSNGDVMMQMPLCGYAMMQMPLVGMSWCKCLLVSMPWCECPFVGKSWCKCPLVGIPWHECFDANTIYSKIPFIFKMRLPQSLKPRYFQNLIYYSWKVILFLT